MKMTYPIFCVRLITEKEMTSLAVKFAACLDEGMIIFLYGSLGAGKTTFVRGVLSGFGYVGKVKSPTYTLVESYELNGQTIHHFDFYRVKDASELSSMGISEYFTPNAMALIEWPEKGFPLLPTPDLSCYIAMINQEREFRIEAQTERGKNALVILLGAMDRQ
jgi:tRNA threonylcarbamoyladenosine biosynthesis protein TsaE